MNFKRKIVIATIRPWNISNAIKFKKNYNSENNIFLITKKENLSFEKLREINPRYIFFPHWSWIIPRDIHENFECIVFHMTDLPYGRGGSPLQNLILNKIYDTKISAIKVVEELDAGNMYLKENFCIKKGSAQEIFTKLSDIIFFKMIPYILKTDLVPSKQEGEGSIFRRRKPAESNIERANILNLDDFYDFIRMLDADGYPNAFLKINNFKVIFNNVSKKNGKLEGLFQIEKVKNE
ncbi:hypothetical protein KAT08_01960 [Candidatus Babeliales bacterium]|nr:hypothetical protein [Candidatus Babeliales bacterium]